MPKITYLKEFEGALWARLELDMIPTDGPVQILTHSEIIELRNAERQAVKDEIDSALNRWQDD